MENNPTAPAPPPTNYNHIKIDPITALQDRIDGLSLAAFEALRGLRDAVAPESGTSSNNDQETAAADVDDLWMRYCRGEEQVVAMVEDSKFNPGGNGFKVRDDFVKWHRTVEREEDTELVQELAAAVLEKSDQIDQAVDQLPGMNRNRKQQMEYLEQLIKENATTMDELTQVYGHAKAIRDKCRDFVLDNSASALGISDK